MEEIPIINGSILDIKLRVKDGESLPVDTMIIHQCNINNSPKVAGLAKQVFDKHPQCNVQELVNEENLGGYYLFDTENYVVANIYSQKHRGKANSTDDTANKRLRWFMEAMDKLTLELDYSNLQTLAVPWGFGCGLAGGDWNRYHKLFLKLHNKRSPVPLVYYKV